MSSNSTRLGFQAGLVAGAAAGVVMLAARVALDVPTIPELVLDQLTLLIPPALFAFVLDHLLFLAKPLMMGVVVVGQLLICGGLGALYGRAIETLRSPDGSERWTLALGFAAALWVVIAVVLLPLVGAGLLGSALPVGAAVTSATLLAAALVYGLALVSIPDWTVDRVGIAGMGTSLRRRAVLRGIGWGAVAIAAGAFVVRGGTLIATNAASTLNSRRPPGKLPPAITPNLDFYTVSKNLGDPAVDVTTWTLEITGMVDKPLSLTYDQLIALPSTEQYVTLECISNYIGGNLISNTIWKGVPFKDLLAMAQPKAGVTKVRMTGADGYDDSVAFDRAMSPANLLAWEMNGEKLPGAHGFPARLLVPGIYGMKNVKWITKVELINYDFQGYWQERGWSDSAYVKEMSRIDLPPAGGTFPVGPLEFGGIAFSGDKGIGSVELSVDGGKTWQKATLEQALSPYSWVLWTLDWDASVGEHTVLVRATDKSGKLQTAEAADTLPDGASGYHSIVVSIQPEKS